MYSKVAWGQIVEDFVIDTSFLKEMQFPGLLVLVWLSLFRGLVLVSQDNNKAWADKMAHISFQRTGSQSLFPSPHFELSFLWYHSISPFGQIFWYFDDDFQVSLKEKMKLAEFLLQYQQK